MSERRSRGSEPPRLVYDEVLRYVLIMFAALSFIASALWLAVAVHTMFYDSLGNYHRPTLIHVMSNTALGLAPFVVPVLLIVAARVLGFGRARRSPTSASRLPQK
jgi:hypothetical protein